MEADSFEHQRVTHIRVSMGNRLCTLGFLGDQGTPFPYKSHMLKRLQLIPWIQWVAWRTVPVTGARAGHGGQYTIPVAIRWPIIPIPLHMEDRQAPETYRFRCNQGQKGSVMHRFRGYRGKLDAQKYQVPPRFPRLRGCTRPIVNSWVKFFPWGTGEGIPFWACRLSVVKQNRHAAGTWVGTWSWPLRGVRGFRGVQHGGHDLWSVSASSGLCPIPAMSSKIDTRPFHGGTYRPRRRAYPLGGQL